MLSSNKFYTRSPGTITHRNSKPHNIGEDERAEAVSPTTYVKAQHCQPSNRGTESLPTYLPELGECSGRIHFPWLELTKRQNTIS